MKSISCTICLRISSHNQAIRVALFSTKIYKGTEEIKDDNDLD